MTEFCNNNKELPLKISVYNHTNNGDHKLYGSTMTTARQIEMKAAGEHLILTNAKKQKIGYIAFNQFQMDMRPSLGEYLAKGW
mgnify:CR=1 FL=1|jgi:hypothetical protein